MQKQQKISLQGAICVSDNHNITTECIVRGAQQQETVIQVIMGLMVGLVTLGLGMLGLLILKCLFQT